MPPHLARIYDASSVSSAEDNRSAGILSGGSEFIANRAILAGAMNGQSAMTEGMRFTGGDVVSGPLSFVVCHSDIQRNPSRVVFLISKDSASREDERGGRSVRF